MMMKKKRMIALMIIALMIIMMRKSLNNLKNYLRMDFIFLINMIWLIRSLLKIKLCNFFPKEKK